jgi:hypothetical protein
LLRALRICFQFTRSLVSKGAQGRSYDRRREESQWFVFYREY